jgi:hypothetical protein
MKYFLALAHEQPADARVHIELNEDGFARIAGGVWKTVDELAIDLEIYAQRRYGFAACRDHRDIGSELAQFFWDLHHRRLPAER